jgi:3-mercaptopyruvate sulfurtransferase SseA
MKDPPTKNSGPCTKCPARHPERGRVTASESPPIGLDGTLEPVRRPHLAKVSVRSPQQFQGSIRDWMQPRRETTGAGPRGIRDGWVL